MVHRFLEQQSKDRNFDARRDDRSAQGAAVEKMANIAVAKENKETALNDASEGKVRKVTRAASGTI